MSVTSRIKSTTASPTVAPLLPRGSLIYSAAVITKRLGGYKSNLLALERVYGHRREGAPIFYGSGANYIAHNYFADSLTPDQVLRQHTLFGFYALGLSKSVEAKWARELKVGASLHATRYKKTSVSEMGTGGLKWCPDCARSDHSEVGLSAWRVIHQLPFIQSCPAHGVPLIASCENCNKPLDAGDQFRLPGDSCPACGSEKFTSLPVTANKGHLSLVLKCEEAFLARSDKFRPIAWAARMKKFLDSFESPRTALKQLSSMICAKWEVQSPEEVSAILSFPLGKYYVQSSLAGHATKIPLVAQVIVLDAMEYTN